MCCFSFCNRGVRKVLYEIRRLKKCYNGEIVLDIDSLDIERGRIYGLVGANGAGKTTLLEILDLLIPPTSGDVKFKGKPLFAPETLTDVRDSVTYVAQNPVMFRGTVLANVEYGLRVRGISRTERRRRAMDALERTRLANLVARTAKELSAGEKQRVAIARAVCLQPEVLLLDEPTASVDRENVPVIHDLIKEIHGDLGISIIFTSHDIDETVSLGDEFVALERGRVGEFPVKNILRGKIRSNGERAFVFVENDVRIEVATARTGNAKISIDPRDIILSRQAFDSSARNRFKGRIIDIQVRDGVVEVKVDIGVPILSAITRRSFREMNLKTGDEIFVSFKSVAVRIH